jgi:Short C-terminal domain
LLDHASLLQKILDQRDVVKGSTNGTTTAIATIEPMQRGGGGGGGVGESSATNRMKHVKELYENGLISSSEYEAKRQDILAGL